MTGTFRMTVDDVFAFGSKLIFTGKFQRREPGEIKGLVQIVVDGTPLRKLKIEGEVFDNRPEHSLWATIPERLNIEELKGKQVTLISEVDDDSIARSDEPMWSGE